MAKFEVGLQWTIIVVQAVFNYGAYWIEDDIVTVQYVGPCGGTTGQITDNGRLITVDCGGGNILTYTRLD